MYYILCIFYYESLYKLRTCKNVLDAKKNSRADSLEYARIHLRMYTSYYFLCMRVIHYNKMFCLTMEDAMCGAQ